MSISAEFGIALKRLRKMRRWSRKDLMAKTKVAASSIANIENGIQSPSLEIADRLVRPFGKQIYFRDIESPNEASK